MPKSQRPKGKSKGKGMPSTEYDETVSGKIKMPNHRMGEMFGRVVEIYGNDRMQVFCEDGQHRAGRIRGKIKKRVWIRKGDLVVINPWEFETQTKDKMEKCEISWRYMKNEISWLERHNRIPKILDINNILL